VGLQGILSKVDGQDEVMRNGLRRSRIILGKKAKGRESCLKVM